MYRYRRLDGARQYAKAHGYQGAMYPWQTADGGDEETQIVHYNPNNDSWGPDLSRRQRHVSIAIFLNTWRYWADTKDKKFLEQYGGELMLDIARFWASISHLDESTGRYTIEGVMGPDEFHEKLPDSNSHGLKDNAYTNIMVVWLLERALHIVDELSAKTLHRLNQKMGFEISETDKWNDICHKMNVIISADGIISQFDGYMDLKELDWDYYRKKYGNIHRMDRILKSEKKSPDDYKLAKQADTLMTYYVLPPEEVARILNKLGYSVDDPIRLMQKNYEYYEQRTSHGSTLSKVVHAVISSYMDAPDIAWEWFTEAMMSDIYDTQGGTTPEGIHCGVMAGTLDVVTRYFAGIDFSKTVPEINPHLPPHWQALAMKVCHQSIWYDIKFSHNKITLTVSGKMNAPTPIKIKGKTVRFSPNKSHTISLKS
jgi:trehalose/maltose hydrolase-like predicted phosphorylase